MKGVIRTCRGMLGTPPEAVKKIVDRSACQADVCRHAVPDLTGLSDLNRIPRLGLARPRVGYVAVVRIGFIGDEQNVCGDQDRWEAAPGE